LDSNTQNGDDSKMEVGGVLKQRFKCFQIGVYIPCS
jgi:hypothetical protein